MLIHSQWNQNKEQSLMQNNQTTIVVDSDNAVSLNIIEFAAGYILCVDNKPILFAETAQDAVQSVTWLAKKILNLTEPEPEVEPKSVSEGLPPHVPHKGDKTHNT